MQKSSTAPVNVCEVMSFVSAVLKNLESDQGHMNIILILIYLSEDRGMSVMPPPHIYSLSFILAVIIYLNNVSHCLLLHVWPNFVNLYYVYESAFCLFSAHPAHRQLLLQKQIKTTL